MVNFFKIYLREPIKTAIIVLLVGILSFALVYQVEQYHEALESFEKSQYAYRGVGSVKGHNNLNQQAFFLSQLSKNPLPDDAVFEAQYHSVVRQNTSCYLTPEQIGFLRNIDCVSYMDQRHMTAGISQDGFLRNDDTISETYDYCNRLILEGTLLEIREGMEQGSADRLEGSLEWSKRDFNTLIFDDCKILAGSREINIDGETISVNAYVKKGPLGDPVVVRSYTDKTLINAEHPEYPSCYEYISRPMYYIRSNYIYDLHFQSSMKIGNRFVLIVRYEPILCGATMEPDSCGGFMLYDYLIEDDCPAVWDITEAPDDYLSMEEYQPLKVYIEITNADPYTFDVVYTTDMGAIPEVVNNNLCIIDGRPIEQSDSQANICVISSDMAGKNNLQPGDTISLLLGSVLNEQYATVGTIAVVRERFAPEQTPTQFEVVGVYAGTYMDTDDPRETYSCNTIFVPNSCLPNACAWQIHAYSYGEVSFAVCDLQSSALFLEEYAAEFNQRGLILQYNDKDIVPVLASFSRSEKTSMIRIFFIGIMTLIAICTITYISFLSKRREYAVLRALGSEKHSAEMKIVVPFLSFLLVAILAGGGCCVIFFHRSGGLAQKTSVLICIAEVTITIFVVWLRMWRISRTSVLLNLQGARNTKRSSAAPLPQEKTHGTDPRRSSVSVVGQVQLESIMKHRPPFRKPGKLEFRDAIRTNKRRMGKTCLLVATAAALVAGVMQLEYVKLAYSELREETPVIAVFHDIPVFYIQKSLVDTGLVTAISYVDNVPKKAEMMQGVSFEIVSTNCLEDIVDDELIAFMDGYNSENFKRFGEIILLPTDILDQNGLHTGDRVLVSGAGIYQKSREYYTNEYKTKYGEDHTDGEIAQMAEHAADERMTRYGVSYTIVGVCNTQYAVAPCSQNVYSPVFYGTSMGRIEVQLAGIDSVEAVREFAKPFYEQDPSHFHLDMGKVEGVIETEHMLNQLSPIVQGLFILLAAGFAVMNILHQRKEIALYRVLGRTVRSVIWMLLIEQWNICLFGIIVGEVLLGLINKAKWALLPQMPFLLLYLAVTGVAVVLTSFIWMQSRLINGLKAKQ